MTLPIAADAAKLPALLISGDYAIAANIPLFGTFLRLRDGVCDWGINGPSAEGQ
jgi:hypothetical protein